MDARVGNGSQGEHFWGNSRGCVKVSLEGVSPFVDRQSTNAPTAVPGGGSFWALVAFPHESGRKRAERRRPGSVMIRT